MQRSQLPKVFVPTLEAKLWSAGYDYKKVTLHKFERRQVADPSTYKFVGPASMQPAVELIFKCTETGAERRWGLE